MKQVKSQTFAKGIITLFISQLVIKMLGFVYRVVITRIDGFGDLGNSYYGGAFQFYTAILAVSTVGIPAAIAKLVSEKVALNDYKGAHKIFKTALVLFTVIGICGTAFMYFGADLMSSWIENPGVAMSLRSLSLSIFFVALASVIRGYFQGYCDMKPQANSQVIDQLAKCFFTIWLTWFAGQHIFEIAGFFGINLNVEDKGDLIAQVLAAVATLGSTIGTLFSLSYLLVYYNRRKKSIKKSVLEARQLSNESGKKIAISLFSLSIPIMLGAVITSIAGLVNLFTVIPRLLVSGKTEMEAKILYGIITGKSDTLLNLPLALNVVYATSLVPNISKAIALKDTEGAAKKISFSLFSTMLITLPAAVGISVLADPIIWTIFDKTPDGGFYIRVSAYAVVFIALAQTLSGALQGMGKVAVPAIALFTGAALKYLLNYILVAIPEINVMGAAYSTIACYGVAFIISFIVLNKNINLKLDYIKCFVKPTIASAVMGIFAYCCYPFCYNILSSIKLSTIITICLSIGVYGVMILLLRAFSNDELVRLPVVGKVFKKFIKEK